jgi:AAA15 family ATPase/GTPase
MIVSFSMMNFRSVKEKVTLSFEPENSNNLDHYYIFEPMPGLKLLKLGLIYGSNGSGKTTLLKGIEFLKSIVTNPIRQKHELLNFSPFLFDALTPTQESAFELIFVQNNTKYFYEIRFTKEFILYERLDSYSPKKSLVYERTTDKDKQLSEIKFGLKTKIKKAQQDSLEANTLWNMPVLAGFLRTNIDSEELRSVVQWFHSVLGSLILPDTNLAYSVNHDLEDNRISKSHILQFLKKADFKISDLAVEKKIIDHDEDIREIFKILNRKAKKRIDDGKDLMPEDQTESLEVHFRHSVLNNNKETRYTLPYEAESQGTQRYFQFSGLLDRMLSKPQIVLIDELESSLHPDLLKHFLLLFLVNVKHSQLIATTHHRELLMNRDLFRDDVIWFTEKGADGSMDLYSLSDFDSTIVRDTTSVYNAYKSGKLGAIPDLGDYYLDMEDDKEQ